MGAKAASSYQEDGSYFYTCRKNGVERKYMIFSDGEQPNSSKLYEKETDQRNGVLVSVPIKSGDREEFIEKIREQLSYFSNVYFEECRINNDFKILRNKLFQYSEIHGYNVLHLTLDDVCYPIDFQKLGIQPIDIPIALRFSLSDGLAVIPNRENIEYTKESRKIILDRIKEVADHLISQFNDKSSMFETVEELYKFYDRGTGRFVNLSDSITIEVSAFSVFSTLSFNEATLKGVSKLNTSTIYANRRKVFNLYKAISKITKGRFIKDIANSYRYGDIYNILTTGKNSYSAYTPIFYKEIPNGKRLTYIKSLHPEAAFFRKTKEWKLKVKTGGEDNCLHTLLRLKEYPRSEWRQVIKDWLFIVEYFTKKVTKEEDIVIPQSWVDANKVVRTLTKKLEGEVNFKFARDAEKSINGSCVFDSSVTKLKSPTIKSKLIIYGNEENKEKLSDAFALNNNKNTKIALLGKNDYKKIKELNHYNFMDIKDVESTHNKVIINYVTAWKVSQFVKNYTEVFNFKDSLQGVCTPIYNDLVQLQLFLDSNRLISNNLLTACVELCDEKGWKDHTIDAIMTRLSKDIDKINILHLFGSTSSYYNSNNLKTGALPVIKELFIARKVKMDYQNYVAPPILVKDEVKVEDEPAPELEEDLIDSNIQITI